ncbi:hypothetical protein INS49_006967 [Diaporthe citri]|uniref:uncharacterized protein n=1 Tax=Diaporthe citri TaxID=83186 RepID=UPI001C80961C|nr:uncharacterized protein INS49_006967 [Diaporthe citri]KAG6365357.1 hypothetical protein INS49_006967 [Diaporthe citri]
MVETQYYELTEAEAQPTTNGGCKKRLRFMSKLSKPWRMALLGVTFALLVVIAAYLCLILAYVVAILWKANRLPDRSESHYNLYKNTRFEACRATPSPHFNCSIFTDDWTQPPDGAHYSLWNHGRAVIHGPPGNWCDAASCFNAWKVVPSTPRHSAFSLTTLLIWAQLCFTALSILWELYKTLSPPNKCTGPGFWDWFFLIKDAITLGFWVGGFASLLGDISSAAPVSIVAWLSICNLWIDLRCHPWSCWSVFVRHPRIKKTLFWMLNVVVLSHWAATVYALRVYWEFYDFTGAPDTGRVRKYNINKYDCLEDQLSSAPGTSSCSAESLCAESAFFTSPDFHSHRAMLVLLVTYSAPAAASLIFFAVAIVALVFLLSLHRWAPQIIQRPVRSGWLPKRSKTGERIASFQLIFTFFFALAGVVFGAYILAQGYLNWDLERIQYGGEGTIVWNPNCTAVHVGISPEWY